MKLISEIISKILKHLNTIKHQIKVIYNQLPVKIRRFVEITGKIIAYVFIYLFLVIFCMYIVLYIRGY